MFVLMNEIGIINQLASARFEAAQSDGLRLSHFTLLNHLVRVGDGRTPVAIARAFQVTKGAITNTMHRLEERGLIHLTPDPDDGRGKRVWITEAGRARRLAAIASAEQAFAGIAAAIGASSVEAMIPELRRLRQLLDAARD
jgi:DNA-binding MarR family transcriptional regulator